MHLCTENIRSRIRSPRSLPSKIHAATPPQNLAAVESLLRAKRAARSSFSWPHGLLSERNREDQHAFYLAAAFPIGTKWLGALFTYVRHSVLPRHSYDLASYGNIARYCIFEASGVHATYLISNIIPAVVRSAPRDLSRDAIQISRPRRFEAAGRRAFGSGTRCPQRVYLFRPPCAPHFRYVRYAPPITKVGVDARRHTRNCSQLAAP